MFYHVCFLSPTPFVCMCVYNIAYKCINECLSIYNVYINICAKFFSELFKGKLHTSFTPKYFREYFLRIGLFSCITII